MAQKDREVASVDQAVVVLVEGRIHGDLAGVVDYGQILDGTFADLDADGRLDCCENEVPCVPCDADLTDDFLVDGGDIAVMLDAWGAAASDTVADLDADGTVDGEDLAILLGSWGPCP